MVQTKEIAGLTIVLPIDEEPTMLTPIAPRLDTFDGKVVGFLSNTKDNVDHLFADMQTHLEAMYTPKGVIHRAKDHFAAPAASDIIEALHHDCDVVFTAAGA